LTRDGSAGYGIFLLIGTLLACEGEVPQPRQNALLVNVQNVPTRTVRLTVAGKLDGKPSKEQKEIPAPYQRFAVPFASEVNGHLSLDLKAFDSDGCLQGTANVQTTLPTDGLRELSVAISAQSPRKCGSLAPCKDGSVCPFTPQLTAENLWAMWMNSPSDIWAVGENMTALHYDGVTWHSSQLPALTSPSSLFGVWASDANNVWAVGSSGRTFRYDGTRWSNMLNGAAVGDIFYSVWGVSPNDVWAVGKPATTTTNTFWHWNGTSWNRDNPPGTMGTLFSVYATATDNIYVSGPAGLILRWDGTIWSQVNPAPTTRDILFLRGTSANNIFGGCTGGIIVRYNGSAWTQITNTSTGGDINGLFVGSDAVYAAAFYAGAPLNNLVKGKPPFDSFAGQQTGVTSYLSSVVVGSNGIGWVAGGLGFIGYFDTRP